MTERTGIICAGNWIVDIVHEIEHWPRESDLVRIDGQDRGMGGGAANVISALARLETGLSLWPVGAIGSDDYGQYIKARCADLGLPTDRFTTRTGVATAHTHVMSVSGQSRTFFYQGGANDALSAADFAQAGLDRLNARIFYLGYLMLLGDLDRIRPGGGTSAAEVLGRAHAAGMTTCVDLVSVDRPDFAASVGASLPHIDYLILNEVEAARASGHPVPSAGEVPSDEALTRMATALIDGGVRQAVIVHCAQKALWIGADGLTLTAVADPLPKDEVASPLGAGDAFCSGVLYGLHEGWSPSRALALGHGIARASLRGLTATEAIPRLDDLIGTLDLG